MQRLREAAKERMKVKEAQAENLTEKFVADMMKQKESGHSENNPDIFTGTGLRSSLRIYNLMDVLDSFFYKLADLNHDLIFADLFQASGGTTTSYLEALFLFVLLYPEIGDKVYTEILDTVPHGQEVTYDDKQR